MLAKTPALGVLECVHHFRFCSHKRQGSLGTAGACICPVRKCPRAPLSLPSQRLWIPKSWDRPKPTCLAPSNFCQRSVFPGSSCLWYVKAGTVESTAPQRVSSKEQHTQLFSRGSAWLPFTQASSVQSQQNLSLRFQDTRIGILLLLHSSYMTLSEKFIYHKYCL